jgi:hypothetical protein
LLTKPIFVVPFGLVLGFVVVLAAAFLVTTFFFTAVLLVAIVLILLILGVKPLFDHIRIWLAEGKDLSTITKFARCAFLLFRVDFCDKNPCSMATPAAGLIDQSAKAVSRYRDGYRLAHSIKGLSQVCKVAGLLAGLFVILFGVFGSATLMRPNPTMFGIASEQTQHNIYLISMIFFGAFVALCGWILGVVMEGYSQQLKATLDSAVHGSPFLSNLQRSQVMRLE